MTVLLDYDGTCVEHVWPGIGRCNFGCIEVIDKLQRSGHDIVLNTMRCEFGDDSLEKALAWFDQAWAHLNPSNRFVMHGADAVGFDLAPIQSTATKLQPPAWDLDQYLKDQVIFIDDQSRGVPLKRAVMIPGLMVDWDEIDRQLEKAGVYENLKPAHAQS